MKEIPVKLQCAYCQRNQSHGGECRRNKFDDTGCLAFQPDPKGCIRNKDTRIHVPLYYNFPPLNTWCNDFTVGDLDSEVNVRRIHGFNWNTKSGELIVCCNIDYYINEYHENYKDPRDKPVLKVVK
jgi:hypothetical protein